MLGKSVLISGKGYIRISLTEEETQKAMEEMMGFNVKQLAQVIKFAKGSSMTIDINQADMIKMLFDKQAISAFTWLNMKLDEKIEREKRGNRD